MFFNAHGNDEEDIYDYDYGAPLAGGGDNFKSKSFKGNSSTTTTNANVIPPFSPIPKAAKTSSSVSFADPTGPRNSSESAMDKAKSIMERYSNKQQHAPPVSNFKVKKAASSFNEDDLSISMDDEGEEEEEEEEASDVNVSESYGVDSSTENKHSKEAPKASSSKPTAFSSTNTKTQHQPSAKSLSQPNASSQGVIKNFSSAVNTRAISDTLGESSGYSDEEFDNEEEELEESIANEEENTSYSRIGYHDDEEDDEGEEESQASSKAKILSFADFAGQSTWDGGSVEEVSYHPEESSIRTEDVSSSMVQPAKQAPPVSSVPANISAKENAPIPSANTTVKPSQSAPVSTTITAVKSTTASSSENSSKASATGAQAKIVLSQPESTSQKAVPQQSITSITPSTVTKQTVSSVPSASVVSSVSSLSQKIAPIKTPATTATATTTSSSSSTVQPSVSSIPKESNSLQHVSSNVPISSAPITSAPYSTTVPPAEPNSYHPQYPPPHWPPYPYQPPQTLPSQPQAQPQQQVPPLQSQPSGPYQPPYPSLPYPSLPPWGMPSGYPYPHPPYPYTPPYMPPFPDPYSMMALYGLPSQNYAFPFTSSLPPPPPNPYYSADSTRQGAQGVMRQSTVKSSSRSGPVSSSSYSSGRAGVGGIVNQDPAVMELVLELNRVQEEANWAKKQLAETMVKLKDSKATETNVARLPTTAAAAAADVTGNQKTVSIAKTKPLVNIRYGGKEENVDDSDGSEDDDDDYSEDFEVSRMTVSTANAVPQDGPTNLPTARQALNNASESGSQPSPKVPPPVASMEPPITNQREHPPPEYRDDHEPERSGSRDEYHFHHHPERASGGYEVVNPAPYAPMDPFITSLTRSFVASQELLRTKLDSLRLRIQTSDSIAQDRRDLEDFMRKSGRQSSQSAPSLASLKSQFEARRLSNEQRLAHVLRESFPEMSQPEIDDLLQSYKT
eukprot:gene758-822_t